MNTVPSAIPGIAVHKKNDPPSHLLSLTKSMPFWMLACSSGFSACAAQF